MVDPALGLTVVFNGCIYNYPELRDSTGAEGPPVLLPGDTEVMLKAYTPGAPRFVERFYGMFAFAIWERDSGRVFLAATAWASSRSISADRQRFRFASTLPALLAGGGIDTAIDPVGLHHYMSLHAVVPAPCTILRGVRSCPAATLLTSSRTARKDARLLGPSIRDAQERREPVRVELWQDLSLMTLRKAVERRMVSDVPVGVLLSGGFD